MARFPAIALTLVAVLAQPAAGAVLSVTTAADSGAGSLREAISTANANGEADEIIFAADYTIVLASTLPNITSEITITGNGWNKTIIDGGDDPGVSVGVRAFFISSNGMLVLDGVTVRNCYRFSGGGAITNQSGVFIFRNSWAQSNRAGYGGWLESYSTSKIEGSTVVGNTSLGGFGGGAVYSSGLGSLRITDSVIAENISAGSGGSIYLANGTLFAERTLIEGSDAAISGGGLYSQGTWVRLANVTVINNWADSGGGLAFASGTNNLLANLTITDNHASSYGGGVVVNGAASVTIQNSIIAGNPDGNCSGVLDSSGYNMEDTDTCSFSESTDSPDTDPLLGQYQIWDQGQTYYVPLLLDSPAIDAGDPGGCRWDDDANPGTPVVLLTADQRGIGRPIDGDGDDAAYCDIGAIESELLIFKDGFESGNTSAWKITIP